jgi:hypothetical protein
LLNEEKRGAENSAKTFYEVDVSSGIDAVFITRENYVEEDHLPQGLSVHIPVVGVRETIEMTIKLPGKNLFL